MTENVKTYEWTIHKNKVKNQAINKYEKIFNFTYKKRKVNENYTEILLFPYQIGKNLKICHTLWLGSGETYSHSVCLWECQYLT